MSITPRFHNVHIALSMCCANMPIRAVVACWCRRQVSITFSKKGSKTLHQSNVKSTTTPTSPIQYFSPPSTPHTPPKEPRFCQKSTSTSTHLASLRFLLQKNAHHPPTARDHTAQHTLLIISRLAIPIRTRVSLKMVLKNSPHPLTPTPITSPFTL